MSVQDASSHRLPGEALEAFVLRADRRQPWPVSSKGCVVRTAEKILVRHRTRALGFVGLPTGTAITLLPPSETRVKADCHATQYRRDSFQPNDFLNIPAEAAPGAYEISVKVGGESIPPMRPGTGLVAIALAETWPEGPVALTLTIHDLIRQEDETTDCQLVLDRTPPLAAIEVEAIAEHGPAPIVITEVDDRRTLSFVLNEGEVRYCFQAADTETPCLPSELYRKPIALAIYPGLVTLRYQTRDAAGNQSAVFSRALLVVNPFQESEVESLARSAIATAGKSLQNLLDALRSETKRRALPSEWQRARHAVSSTWALLKNALIPGASLLKVAYTRQDTTASHNDVSPDGKKVCFGDTFSNIGSIFTVSDQTTVNLPDVGDLCRFDATGNLIAFVQSLQGYRVSLVDSRTLEVQVLPAHGLDSIMDIAIDADGSLWLAGPRDILRWNPEAGWQPVYHAAADFAVGFGEHFVSVQADGETRIFTLRPFQERSILKIANTDEHTVTRVSPDGQLLLMIVRPLDTESIKVWEWNSVTSTYLARTDFHPQQPHDPLDIVFRSPSKSVALAHDFGVISLWDYEDHKWILRNPEIGVRGDVILNNREGRYARARFLEPERLAALSSHNLSIVRTTAAGKRLASGQAAIVVNDRGDRIITRDNEGRVQLFRFAGDGLGAPTLLQKSSAHSRLALSAAGNLAAVLADSQLQFWDIGDEQITALEHPASRMNASAVGLGPDGHLIAVAGTEADEQDAKIVVWRDGERLATHRQFCLPEGSIFPRDARFLKFSPDGQQLFISCSYGAAESWTLANDHVTAIGPDIMTDSAVFSEQPGRLAFVNASVMVNQSFALQTWSAADGLNSRSYNAEAIDSMDGSRDFALFAASSPSDLVLWNPAIDDAFAVWQDRVPVFKVRAFRVAVASQSRRTFVINTDDELLYWPLDANSLYSSLCTQLHDQIVVQNLHGEICP